MVIIIKEKKDPAPLTITLASVAETPSIELTPIATAPAPTPVGLEVKSTHSDASSNASLAVDSNLASGMSKRNTTSVVRGFSPSHVSSSYRTSNSSFLPGEDSSNKANFLESQAKKKPNIFTFGGSSSEGGSSPRENTDQSYFSKALRRPLENWKQTSFKEEVAMHTIQDDRVMDDDVLGTEGDEIDESAIDDDGSDWGDSNEESGRFSFDGETFFHRIDSRPNLNSRRSLITMMLHQDDRAVALTNTASKLTPSPRGQYLAASPGSGEGIPRSAAQPIIKTPTDVITHQAALSPKTTRKNMLQTELTARVSPASHFSAVTF